MRTGLPGKLLWSSATAAFLLLLLTPGMVHGDGLRAVRPPLGDFELGKPLAQPVHFSLDLEMPNVRGNLWLPQKHVPGLRGPAYRLDRMLKTDPEAQEVRVRFVYYPDSGGALATGPASPHCTFCGSKPWLLLNPGINAIFRQIILSEGGRIGEVDAAYLGTANRILVEAPPINDPDVPYWNPDAFYEVWNKSDEKSAYRALWPAVALVASTLAFAVAALHKAKDRWKRLGALDQD